MKKIICLCLMYCCWWNSMWTQSHPLDYYLPASEYDPSVPTPQSVLGYQVGEWHVSHDQLVYYLKALAEASPRVKLEEYARSHEGRPLILLTITAESNQEQLENIRQDHLKLSDPELSATVDTENLPAVVYQGYSIHGNESSGANAALLVAYHLAAGQDAAVRELLENVVVLFDPCFNPDGLHRFSTWVNMHKGKHPATDPISREFNEPWPGGRTNHYWFDLNRDWLLLTHPESRGRIRNFHRWKPNILTDHHEMGSNATYFFQPGVPSRTNPLTPHRNQELTGAIAQFHAKALDEIGSLYYSEESFDDFYYGKGSTYPDANACIGILFEQASSRGHLKSTSNGLLSFPFTIRNQVRTSLSTLESGRALRKELLEYQRNFYRNAKAEARKDPVKGYVFSSTDASRLHHFVDILQHHQVEVYTLEEEIREEGKQFSAGKSYLVPSEQNQYRLVKAIFETSTQFNDSIFYDVSTWTLPLAFDLQWASLGTKAFPSLKKEQAIPSGALPSGEVIGALDKPYGYLLPWDAYYSPKALYRIMAKGLRSKLAMKTFDLRVAGQEYSFAAGTVFIPTQNQEMSAFAMAQLMQEVADDCAVKIYAIGTGLTPSGIDLGSPSFASLKKPEVLMLVGTGVSAYDAGEVWHLLDTRYAMPLNMLETDDLEDTDIQKYNTIVLADGWYNKVSNGGVEKLKKWVQGGGVLVAMERAVSWAKGKGLAHVKFKEKKESRRKKNIRRPYDRRNEDSGAEVIGGAIFQTQMDLTHPLCFGFEDDQLPVFRQGRLFMELPENPYAAPLWYSSSPLLSGYISEGNLEQLKNSAAIVVSRLGQGKVICLIDNPNFRGFWYGTNKLFANALFFGRSISSQTAENATPKKEE